MSDDPLLNRILAIFNEDDQEDADDQIPEGSPFCVGEEVKDLGSCRLNEAAEADSLADRWLDTPNPAFGERCPRTFLRGEDKRRFLCGVVASIEDGAFS